MQDSWLGSVLLLVLQALRQRGLDAAAIAAQAGIAPQALNDPDTRVDLETSRRFWIAAVEATGFDPCFGLDVADCMHPTSLHAVGFAWMASSSLREAGERLVRYFRVVNSVDRIEIRAEDNVTWLVFQTDGDYTLQRSYDARMGILLRLCQALRGRDFLPAGVRLAREAPADDAAQRMHDYYGIAPEWNATEYAFGVRSADLDVPIPAANIALALSAEQIAADYLARHTRDDMVAQVRHSLIELLPSGKVSRRKVARRLAVSERTLQRRLSESGETFAGLLDSLRQDLAIDYLRQRHHSVNEVAYLLGFAEIASFTRAFRRWTGQAPSVWRESQALAQAEA
ncbi:AraC family transcriptional regulator ligand-binding domain-containing protein [Niveibacterium sp. SC-1]|uniref:AraC family transcriptional regulator n=1 Tax=Niveibacterium sp. SC-1 TaxID=3135646 RepID=UPI00312052B9